MYKVSRKDGKIMVTDTNGKIIYSAEADSIVVYKHQTGNIIAEKISGMTDEGLLMALADVVVIKPV